MNLKSDVLYLFACGVRMLKDRDIAAAKEISRYIDDPDEDVSSLASFFIYRASVAFGGNLQAR